MCQRDTRSQAELLAAAAAAAATGLDLQTANRLAPSVWAFSQASWLAAESNATSTATWPRRRRLQRLSRRITSTEEHHYRPPAIGQPQQLAWAPARWPTDTGRPLTPLSRGTARIVRLWWRCSAAGDTVKRAVRPKMRRIWRQIWRPRNH